MRHELTADRPKRGNGRARRATAGDKPNAPVLVSGVKLALHLGCIRQNIDQMVRNGVIELPASDGLFDQDQCRLKYITHLRSERRSPLRSAADAEHAKAKTQLLQMRIAAACAHCRCSPWPAMAGGSRAA